MSNVVGFVSSVIDLHCHVLPGIDDGPKTIEDSLALARAAAAGGTTTIVATPHVSWEYANSATAITRAVARLNRRLAAEGVAVEICRGAEIAMTRVGDIAPRELSRLTLGKGRWLLVEPSFSPVVEGLEGVVAALQDAGHQVVLAHPERCPAFHRDRSTLERLVGSGALASVTAGSLTGQFGTAVRRLSFDLVRDGLAHNVASDAHDQIRRSPSIRTELERAGFGSLAPWLTHSVPAAILAGRDIPPRPSVELPEDRGRRWPRWLAYRGSASPRA